MIIKRFTLPAIAVPVLALALAGCGGDGDRAAAPAPSPSTSTASPSPSASPTTAAPTTAAPSPTVEDVITKACRLADEATMNDKGSDPKAMTSVAKLAMQASDSEIVRTAAIVENEAAETRAALAQKSDDAFRMKLNLRTAVIELSTACVRAGYVNY